MLHGALLLTADRYFRLPIKARRDEKCNLSICPGYSYAHCAVDSWWSSHLSQLLSGVWSSGARTDRNLLIYHQKNKKHIRPGVMRRTICCYRKLTELTPVDPQRNKGCAQKTFPPFSTPLQCTSMLFFLGFALTLNDHRSPALHYYCCRLLQGALKAAWDCFQTDEWLAVHIDPSFTNPN